MGTGFDSGSVFEIEFFSHTEIYYGGNFISSSGVSISNIAMWDGSSWHPLGGGVAGTVYEIEKHPDGGIVVIGGFTYADGLLVSNIARWDGSSWSAIGGGTYSVPNELAVAPDGTIYIIDTSPITYTKVLRKWDGTAWTDIYNFTDYSSIIELVIDSSGQLIISGSFNTIGGVAANYIARYDGTTFHPMGTLSNAPSILKLDKLGQLYGRLFGTIYKFDGSSWLLHASGSSSILDFDFDTDGNMYVCGSFSTISGSPFSRIAKWDGVAYSALGAGLNTTCSRVWVVDNVVYAGGSFINSGGTISLKRAAYFLLPSLLPVEWGQVSASRNTYGAGIQWETHSEVNCDYFTVQRSQDLANWFDVAYQQGAGNSQSMLKYTAVDRYIPEGKCYYRIVETDFNGDESLSEIVAVDEYSSHNLILLFDGRFLQVQGSEELKPLIDIFSNDGKLVFTAQLNMFEQVDVSPLSTGIYIVRVKENSKVIISEKISVL